MKDFALTDRYAGYTFLYSEFSQEIEELSRVIRQEQMPFYIYETYRTPQRQKNLYIRGNSKIRDPFSSPHVHGLAVDILLNKGMLTNLSGDSKKISDIVENSLQNMQKEKTKNEIYNIGTNFLPSEGILERTQVQDKNVLNAWLKLGHLIATKFPKLVWGGDKNKKQGQLIGADPPHIQFRDAERLMRNKKAIMEIKKAGAPGL